MSTKSAHCNSYHTLVFIIDRIHKELDVSTCTCKRDQRRH